jgi:limonene-1,2-epoxide hydrolase
MSESAMTSQGDTRAAAWVEFFQRGWSLPKPDGFAQHFSPWIHPDIVATQPMMPAVRGRAAFEQMFGQVFALLPDFSLTVLDWAARGDWIHMRSRCRCSIGARQLEFEVCDVLRLSEGLMIERHAYFDPSPLQKAVLLQPRVWPRAMASRWGKAAGSRAAAVTNAGDTLSDSGSANDQTFKGGRFVGFGVLIWFIALLFIRFAGADVFQGGSLGTGFLFAVTFPLSWISTRLCLLLGKTKASHAVPAVAVMSTAALLLDGIAFTWFPWLYGHEPQTNLMGAAWLLWAVGAFLATAFLVGKGSAKGLS